jgi:hypothetical protein
LTFNVQIMFSICERTWFINPIHAERAFLCGAVA